MFEVGTLMMFEFFIWIHSPSRDPTNTVHDWSSLTLFLFEITKKNPTPKDLKVLVKLIRDHFLSSRDAGQLLHSSEVTC